MSGQRFAWLCLFLLATAVAASVVVTVLSDPWREPPLNVLLITHGEDAYQRALTRGAQQAARENHIQLKIRSVEQPTSSSMAESVASAVVDGVNGAVVAQAASDRTAHDLRMLTGVDNIVTCGADAGQPEGLCHVGTGNFSAGRICGSVVRQALPDGGRIVILVDDVYRGVGAERLSGFFEGIRGFAGASTEPSAAPRYTVIECLEDSGHSELRAHNMRTALSRHPEASCVVDLGCWSERTSIATLAATARERAMKLVTFDQSDAALAAVEAGEIYAVIRDNPFMQGYQAVERLAEFIRGGALALPIRGRGHINVPATVVRQENLADFRAQASLRRMPPAA